VGSSNQNETRNEHRLRDMPPLGLIQKKYVFLKKLWPGGSFLLELGFVQVPRNLLLPGYKLPLQIVPSFISFLPLSLLHSARGHTEVGSWKPASPRAIQSAPSSSAPAGGEVDEVASVSTDL
jgi:hypothetical protein